MLHQLLTPGVVSQRAAISACEGSMQWNMHRDLIFGSCAHSSVCVANLLARLGIWYELADADTNHVLYELSLK